MKAKDTVMNPQEMAQTIIGREDLPMGKAIAEEQAEVSFKAGVKEVVRWLEQNFEPTVPMTLDYRKWHTKLKEWGIE